MKQHQSAEHLTAWLYVRRLAQKPRLERAPDFHIFKQTYVIVNAPAQVFFDYDIREGLEKTKFPEDEQVKELSGLLLTGLEDGFINMMNDEQWKDQILRRTSPKWARRRLIPFKKATLRESDELVMSHFQKK